MAKRESARRALDDNEAGFRRKALTAAVAAAIAPGIAIAGAQYGPNIELRAGAGQTGGGDHDRIGAGAAVLYPLPWWQDAHNMPFVDIRGMYFDEGANEINAGIGFRHMLANERWILGGMFNFDTRESTLGNRYHQVSVGGEALGEMFDVRANYYHVLSDKELIGLDPLGGFFRGNRIFTNGIFEEALDGVDFEVGALLPFIEQAETRVFAGGYHYDGEVVGDTTGWRLRGEVRPLKNITLVGHVQDDDLFGTAWGIEARWSFGYKMESGHRTMFERMIQFPERDIDVKTTDEVDEGEEDRRISRDRGDAQNVSPPSGVFHVDNTAAPGGNGSFEAPFDSVAACSAVFADCGIANAMLFVHQGDGTSTGYDQTIVLQPNQLLIGDGLVEPGAPTFGVGSGVAPRLTASSPVIVLSNNNEVAGLNITNDSGMAEVGILGINVSGFDIHDNTIQGMDFVENGALPFEDAEADGIFIGTGGGGALPDGSPNGGQTATVGTIYHNVIRDVSGDGIDLRLETVNGATASQDIAIGHLELKNIGGNGVRSGVYAGYGPALFGTTPGANLDTGGTSTQRLEIWNLSATNVENAGVYARLEGRGNGVGSQTALLSHVHVMNSGDGLRFGNFARGGTVTQMVGITHSSVVNNNEDGIDFENRSFGTYFGNSTANQGVTIDDVHATNNGEDGFRFDNRADADDAPHVFTANQQVALSNVWADGNEEDGFEFHNRADEANPPGGTFATQSVNIATATATANGDAGFFFYNRATNGGVTTQTASVTDVMATGNQEAGFYLRNRGFDDGSATQSFAATGLWATGNHGGDGFRAENEAEDAESVAVQGVSIVNATSSFNEDDGFNFQNTAQDGGTATQSASLSGEELLAEFNEDDGFDFENTAEENGSTATQNFSVMGGRAFGNGSSGFYIENRSFDGGTATQSGTLTTVEAELNDGEGFRVFNYARSEGSTSTQSLGISGAVSRNNDGDGFYFDNRTFDEDGGATLTQTLNLSAVHAELNDGDGFGFRNQIRYGNVGSQSFTVTDAMSLNNDGDGFRIYNRALSFGAGGGTATQTGVLTGSGVVANGNSGNGFEIRNRANGPDMLAEQTVTLSDFEAIDNGSLGVYVGNTSFGDGTANQTVNLLNATTTVEGNGDGGVRVLNDAEEGAAAQGLTISGLTVANNDTVPEEEDEDENGTGLSIINYGGQGSQTAAISNLTITGDAGDGLRIENRSGEQSVSAPGSTISANAGHGVYALNGTFGPGTQSINLSGSVITNNGQDGVRLRNDNGTQSTDLSSADISGNNGEQIYADGDPTQTVVLPDGTVVEDTPIPSP